MSPSGRPPVARKPQQGAHYTESESEFSNDDSGQELLHQRSRRGHERESVELQQPRSIVSPDSSSEEHATSAEQTSQQSRNVFELRRFSHEQVFTRADLQVRP